jgi:hypothetical protein
MKVPPQIVATIHLDGRLKRPTEKAGHGAKPPGTSIDNGERKS